ncbi:hypothetical protein FNV43_RR18804 [Rhamnella rubrinervis]|uniref:TFIIS N-terminal domain-containing protein n=1 Tax=Rhamnella rubrinervis TaxID=2594499 RepID=A0A8K0E6Z8_9ROSA|nr:hypothetical protein FNV43_RR18804 [Rhamnella rubrinervis]
MDYDDFRTVLESSGVDIWTFIDTAIAVASMDYGAELKQRRDGIVERLYAASSAPPPSHRIRNPGAEQNSRPPRHYDRETKASIVEKERVSPSTPQSVSRDDDIEEEGEDLDPYGGLFDDDQKKILEIKEHLEEPDQSEDSLLELLQSLADMDITFQALKETDIGRHVNRLKKHSSNEVRVVVKQLVRKWKDIVDEWVKLNPTGEQTSSALMDGDSPQQKTFQNGHKQVPDFAYSPNPHNGSSGSDKNNSEPERKPKTVPPRREAPPKPTNHSASVLASSAPQNRQREQQKESNFDAEKLASARKRLQANYKEAENAKRQRTIQVMDIHEIPKPKNGFFVKNKGGGGGSQGRHW